MACGSGVVTLAAVAGRCPMVGAIRRPGPTAARSDQRTPNPAGGCPPSERLGPGCDRQAQDPHDPLVAHITTGANGVVEESTRQLHLAGRASRSRMSSSPPVISAHSATDSGSSNAAARTWVRSRLRQAARQTVGRVHPARLVRGVGDHGGRHRVRQLAGSDFHGDRAALQEGPVQGHRARIDLAVQSVQPTRRR